ncbi:hypothetical protein BC833DRAFT_649501 [Globomyces pollinis-pini]|nr:hypothetical protein BC833DRAFT_649501 [Globomyces pollinis-pini]
MAVVYQAETGAPITVPSLANLNLEELQAFLQSKTLIPIDCQILLFADGSQLQQNSSLLDQSIFLFNRAILDQPTDSPHMSIDIEPPATEVAIQDTLVTNADQRPDPQSFLAAFNSHVDYGMALLNIARKHAATCDNLYQQQLIQSKSLMIAINNLESHSSSILDTFDAFNRHAQKEFANHTILLQNFPTDLHTLNQIPIHNAIISEQRTLDDFVPKDKLFAWVKRCQMAHDHLVASTAQLLETMQDIRNGCDVENLTITGVDFSKLKKLLDTTKEVISKIESRQHTFERDASRIALFCNEIKSDSNAVQFDQRLQAIEHLYQIHISDYLPEITKFDRYIRETVIYFSDSKLHLTQVLKGKLQSISHYQSVIASVKPNIASLTNAMNMQSDALLQLLHVHRMAPAWGATLVEIVRRKEYVRVFLKKAKEMADVLSQFRSQEERKRYTFKNEIARYLPNGLITGLDDPPPYCEISVSNTKDSLPKLVLDDISAFERLVSTLRSSQIQGDFNGSVGSDSISKLQATMIKMAPQVEHISLDFEKIIGKSGLVDQTRQRFEDQKRKVQINPSALQELSTPTDSKTMRNRANSKGDSSPTVKRDDTLKAYEARIRSLESLLQERYRSAAIEESQPESVLESSEVKRLKDGFEQEQKLNQTLQEEVALLKAKNKELEKQLEDQEKLKTSHQNLQKDSELVSAKQSQLIERFDHLEKQCGNQKQLLFEVSTHLHSCLSTLKSTDESMINCDSIVIPDSVHSDNLRQMMRKVEDDVISQMALLSSLKASLSESTGGASDEAQTVAVEIVSLLQRVTDLDAHLRDCEAELTQVQAREAVLDDENTSIKVLLTKSETDLQKIQSTNTELVQKIESETKERIEIEQQLKSLSSESDQKQQLVDELQVKITALESRPRNEQTVSEMLLLQGIVQTKSMQISAFKEGIEDWAIVSRLAIEQFSQHYQYWNILHELSNRPESYTIHFQDILDVDPELFPEDLDQFLMASNQLCRQTYDRIMSITNCSPMALANEMKSLFKQYQMNLGRRITFQNFQVGDLTLFVPTKNPQAWAAFHVETPNYFLDLTSHPSFLVRSKKREWILAFILKIQPIVAGEDDDPNLIGLPKGMTYHQCQCKPWV